MGELQAVLVIIGGTVSTVLLVASIVVLFRAAYHKARIEDLERDNTRLENRSDSLEKDLGRAEVKLAASEARERSLENENRVLMDMVTQRANVGQVMEMLQEHHEEARLHWKQIGEALKSLKGGDNGHNRAQDR